MKQRDKNHNSREENHIIKEDNRRFSATTKKKILPDERRSEPAKKLNTVIVS